MPKNAFFWLLRPREGQISLLKEAKSMHLLAHEVNAQNRRRECLRHKGNCDARTEWLLGFALLHLVE